MSDSTYQDPEQLRQQQGIDSPVESRSKVEKIKLASKGLRGNVLEEINDDSLPAVSEDSIQLMKHFGMYQQDDRDIRAARRKQGLDRDHSFMVRTKVPGGRLTAEQYLVLDDCASQFANGSIRLTTRQTIQFHGVGKGKLQGLAQLLNTRLLTTYGACGDVVRNVMTCPVIDLDPRPEWAGRDVFTELSRQISDRTLPRTTAFYDVFINGERDKELAPTIEVRSQVEDIYGENYMPRKFKIAITTPEDNCIDIFTHDLGIVAIIENGELKGYNFLIGGGMGHGHNKLETYARAASPVAFISPDDVLAAVDAMITIQRDYGNRLDRKNARLKYLVDKVGLDWFREEIGRRLGKTIPDAVPIAADRWGFDDHLGWHEQKQPGLYYVGINVENGRLIDRPGKPVRSVLRKIVEEFAPEVRITGQQNLILANISESNRDKIQKLLDNIELPTSVNGKLSNLRRYGFACVALPTCGLALAEAERALPQLMSLLEEKGHGNERISIRMSGCPNSCSRPPAAELGLIGSGPGKYNIYVGGDFEGTRINKIYKTRVPFEQLPDEIGALIDQWHKEKQENEAFGDWSHRVLVES